MKHSPHRRTLITVGIIIVGVLVYASTTGAGPLDPPNGPISETSPSLSDLASDLALLQSQVASLGSLGDRDLYPGQSGLVSYSITSPSGTIPGSGIVRKIYVDNNYEAAPQFGTFTGECRLQAGDGSAFEFALLRGTANDDIGTAVGVFEPHMAFTGGLTVTMGPNAVFRVNILVEHD